MSTKLQSVRRSLFNEYDDHEDDENKSYENSSKHPTHLSFGTVKLSNAFVVCILIGIISIAALSKLINCFYFFKRTYTYAVDKMIKKKKPEEEDKEEYNSSSITMVLLRCQNCIEKKRRWIAQRICTVYLL